MGHVIPFDEYQDRSPSFLLVGIVGVSLVVLWYMCRRHRKRPRSRRSLFAIKVWIFCMRIDLFYRPSDVKMHAMGHWGSTSISADQLYYNIIITMSYGNNYKLVIIQSIMYYIRTYNYLYNHYLWCSYYHYKSIDNFEFLGSTLRNHFPSAVTQTIFTLITLAGLNFLAKSLLCACMRAMLYIFKIVSAVLIKSMQCDFYALHVPPVYTHETLV